MLLLGAGPTESFRHPRPAGPGTDACPLYPGKRYLDWELRDPAGNGIDAVRPIRDEIEQRIRGLLAELEIPVPA
jgi:hypothetical protein